MSNSEYKAASDQELLQMLANAQCTYASCGGHGKAEMNRIWVERYKAELTAREIAIPENDELYKVGTFNGKGSY